MARMTIDEHATTFAGLPVRDFEGGEHLTSNEAWAIRVEYEADVPWTDVFASFIESPGAADVRAFVVGSWGDVATGTSPDQVVAAIVAARDRLPNLEALFFGDIILEEAEISWIVQGDVSPLLAAFPRLTHFQVRGGTGLSLGSLHHSALKTLIVESGGLDASVVRQVAASALPKLEHLELWLGDSGYGATWTLDDLAPVLEGSRFPALRTLALRDSEQADALAEAIAKSKIIERIDVLDLSLGTLGDAGASALLATSAVKRLKHLDLNHNFISDKLVDALDALGISVDTSEGNPNAGEDDRYVAVSE